MKVLELVRLDLALHGRRFILLEFGLTAPAMILGGMLIILRSYWPLGTYILLVGINYLPLLALAVSLRRSQPGAGESRSEIAGEVRKFGLMQLLILVPFSIPVLTLLQRPSAARRGLPAPKP